MSTKQLQLLDYNSLIMWNCYLMVVNNICQFLLDLYIIIIIAVLYFNLFYFLKIMMVNYNKDSSQTVFLLPHLQHVTR